MYSTAQMAMLPTTDEIASCRLLAGTALSGEAISTIPLYIVSVYVVRVMCTTSILHFNLRLLFIWQSIAGMLFGAGKFYIDAVNIFFMSTTTNNFPFPGSVLDRFLARFGIVSNISLTPLFVFERILATRNVSTYENSSTRRYHTLYVLMLLSLGMAAYLSLMDAVGMVHHNHRSSMLIYGFYIAAGVVAYVVLVLVLRYHERSYKEEKRRRHEHSLSRRYQRSENIRSSRQLLPVVFLHVLQNAPACVYFYLAYSGKFNDELKRVTYSGLLGICNCWLCIALQSSIILYHPILRREAIAKLRQCYCFRVFLRWGLENRVTPASVGHNAFMVGSAGGAQQSEQGENKPLPLPPVSYCALKAIDGQKLISQVEDRQAEHFENLISYWDVNDPQREGE